VLSFHLIHGATRLHVPRRLGGDNRDACKTVLKHGTKLASARHSAADVTDVRFSNARWRATPVITWLKSSWEDAEVTQWICYDLANTGDPVLSLQDASQPFKDRTMDRSERRERRKQELEKLSLEQLGGIRPFRKDQVTAVKTEPSNPTLLSKAEMMETILAHEGLGQE